MQDVHDKSSMSGSRKSATHGKRLMGKTQLHVTCKVQCQLVMPTQGGSVSEWIVLEHNCE